MAALTRSNRVKAFRISDESSQSMEVENEADFDLRIYSNQIQQSIAGEGELGFYVLSVIDELNCGDPERQFAALVQLPKVYNFKDEDINEGLVPTLVDYLRRAEWPQLQTHAARILRYLGKENIFVLTKTEAAPEFVKLLESPNEDVQQQALWALPHIVDSHVECSDGITLNERLFFILKIYYFHHRDKVRFTLFRDVLLLMLRISRWESVDKTIDFLECLKPLLEMEEDEELLKEVCTVVLHCSEGEIERKEAIVQTGVYPRLVKLVFHSCPDVVRPVMETIARIARFGIYDEILSSKVLSRILSILSREDNTDTVRELHIRACQIISSITRGTQNDIDLLIKADLFPTLVGFLGTEAGGDVKKEAAHAICNAICGGREEQVEYFVDLGCLELVGDLLTPDDVLLTKACLQGIENMLKVAVGSHKYTNLFNSTHIKTKIYELNIFKNSWDFYDNDVYIQAKRILDTYLVNCPDSGDDTKKSDILVCEDREDLYSDRRDILKIKEILKSSGI